MYPKDKYEWKVILWGLGCIFFGAFLSLIESDWQWLERSGSLVVIVALRFFWRDRVDRDEAFIKEMADYEKECRETLDQITSKTDFSKTKLILYYKVDEDKAKEIIEMQRTRYTNIEVNLAIFGTFIWGYGKPVACAIWEIGSCA
ncbi:hypothetical protein [Colwellia sp. 20A7]|uniref:hypothetical protein n=1 Tax=Colwellia sp. 20A7 TaxID=2689569 RepID=UPI00135B4C4D|nr:hypothetical protein [Colwellia sp. 20A7]